MTQSRRPTLERSADQLMRRMLNSVARLQATCERDAEERRRLREEHQRGIQAAEKIARDSAQRDLASAHGLANPRSLGSRLRADLGALATVVVQHADPGTPPSAFQDALAEWRRLSVSAEQRAKAFQAATDAWSQRLMKRAKSAPQVTGDLWRDLDRLDVIHRTVSSLERALVAEKIRDVSGAADVVMAAEAARQNSGQQHLAAEVRSAIEAVESLVGLAGAPWSDSRWDSPVPADTVQRFIRLGELHVAVPESLGIASIPALAAFPLEAGIAVGADVSSRDRATSLVRALILRLFSAVPPGDLQIRAVDPVSLGQSVAEFRHLSEYDSQLMDEKTWTSERDIERLLDGLSDHLEVVISKYLRGQFRTIDDYNQQAGEVGEPYRVLVVFDYPSGFSDRSSRKLLSLIENGPRCGVYTIVHYDRRAESSTGRSDVSIERLVHSMQKVIWTQSGATLELAEPVGQVALGLMPDEAAPISFDQDGRPETGFARLLPRIGASVRESQARPPAVTLETLLPVLNRSRTGALPDFDPGASAFSTSPATWWRGRTATAAVAPIGRSGAQGVTSMYFSSTEVAGGAIMVGLPRSGKTTSLHSMILTMSMLYSPEELELYLIDAKHGVEFKVYENLPHARMVSVHSEREFSLAVLRSIEAEIRRRAELMKADGAGRANLTEYRKATGAKLSRIVVIIDEFHEIFEEPDRVGQEAFAAFSNIVRMGPFSGVHIVVASQTLSSMPAMDRPTLMLLPQRVVFMCNEYDAEIVMGDTNKAPRLLLKTGEGLFNPSRGEESQNQPFQGLYIATDIRGVLIGQLAQKAKAAGWTQRARVFDGDAVVARPLTNATGTGANTRLSIPLGEPFTLADQESVVLRRTRGANLLLLGDGDEETAHDVALRGALHSCILAATSQGAAVTVLDFSGDEDIDDGLSMMDVAERLGASYVRSRGSDAVFTALATTVEARTSASDYRQPSKLLMLFGLERALSLYPVDSYSSEASDEPSSSARLAAILTGGPEVGVHVAISTDRAKTVERRLGTDLLQELSLRVAGSGADQQDLASASGQYGDVAPLRPGQLLIGDLGKGTTKRIRGYTILTDATIPTTQGE